MGTGSRNPMGRDPHGCGCCNVDIHIEARGDVHVHNCGRSDDADSTRPDCAPCFPPTGACLPVVPGAKHKLSREYKLTTLSERVAVPSSLAAAAMHMCRRFLLGKTPANPLETTAFVTFGQMPRDFLACIIAAFEAMDPVQRRRLFAPALDLDPEQPIDETAMTTALAQELSRRVGLLVYGDQVALDTERPGRMRVYEPHGEDFFSQVRICRINDLRTANFIPEVPVADYLPSEIEQQCESKIVNGQSQVVCEVQTTNCPGNTIGGVCARVLDVATGDGVTLEGVNYFSIDAKVRFYDTETGAAVRDVDTQVWGDVDTPVLDVNNDNALINDCRVHDRLTFQVPEDLAPATYQIRVVVPNITGIAAFGTELTSSTEYLKVIPPATARFQIVTERIGARQETSPDWLGSDEVGLRTLAAAFGLDFMPIDLAPQDPNTNVLNVTFKDLLQDVDFDSGMSPRDITRQVFVHDQPILAMLLIVFGDEIDSQGAYDNEIHSWLEYFWDLIKKEAGYIAAALAALGGLSALTKLGSLGIWVTVIALAVTVVVDVIIAFWAPADPLIRDTIALSVNDLASLTSANGPVPEPATFKRENDITVNVNKTIPPIKGPLEYHETREYVGPDSRYEITYRYNRTN